MKTPLTQPDLIATAKTFCAEKHAYKELFGVTDGKAVGTFIEHKFQARIEAKFDVPIGSSASKLDFPSIETKVEITSINRLHLFFPYKTARQKIYGLGYNVLLLIYDKRDNPHNRTSTLDLMSCTFIEKDHTADYRTTRVIREVLDHDGNRDDIFACLNDCLLPGDEAACNTLTDEILHSPPAQGYLRAFAATQWRLWYSRAVNLTESAAGVVKIV